jgi:hypothetical protein
MTDRQLLQQALDAMRDAAYDEEGYTINADLAEAHDALRERLAQPEEKYQYGTPLLDLFTREQTHE